RIDGELLLRTLMAHLRGEPRVVRVAQVPRREQEDARRASRERDRLVTEQTAHTNRIKALLRLQGMAVGYARRRDWLHWLARQRDWQGQPLSSHLLAEVTREHARLMLVREQLAALEQAQAAQASAIPAPMAERRDLLQRLKALGPAFAATLTNEVFYKDFRNRRQVGAYCGLTPSPGPRGGTDRRQGITKAGHPGAAALCRAPCRMDNDRATHGPNKQPFCRWVSSSWLPRRKHAECGSRTRWSNRI